MKFGSKTKKVDLDFQPIEEEETEVDVFNRNMRTIFTAFKLKPFESMRKALFYKDEEGDEIVVKDLAELNNALSITNSNFILANTGKKSKPTVYRNKLIASGATSQVFDGYYEIDGKSFDD